MNLKKIVFYLVFIMVLGFGTLCAAVIQTQVSNNNENIVAELTALTLQNNIITVRIKIINKSDASDKFDFYFKDCYIIDEANQKKYYILKDSEGRCIGGPFSSDGDGGRFEFWIKSQNMMNMWAKFPLPTDNPGSDSMGILKHESSPVKVERGDLITDANCKYAGSRLPQAGAKANKFTIFIVCP